MEVGSGCKEHLIFIIEVLLGATKSNNINGAYKGPQWFTNWWPRVFQLDPIAQFGKEHTIHAVIKDLT